MATYIPGVTDYIPQLQPFQPDYNFLANVLQTKQSKYDANHKKISEAYGTLLNSDMMRTDNIEKRNEFFKMVDGDIKRISGLDLSLEQNTASANKIFESFYQNKDMVKDMMFTKEYQAQKQTGEILRNCTDPKKCGGSAWDEADRALDYRATEFKNASKEEAMTMSPGRYVPRINVQEKAVDYLKELFGKGGDGGFGVESISYSADGKYKITSKNGKNLEVPLQQLMEGQFGKDQNIIDMYNTQAYVKRKDYIASTAAQFGGDEDLTEDEYFKIVDQSVQASQAAYAQAQALENKVRNKQQILNNQIKTNGSTGTDDQAKAYASAGVDAVAAKEALAYHQETQTMIKSMFDAGDNRAMRRARVDQYFGRTIMSKDLSESATRAAAMTGSVKVDADPYHLSYYNNSLDIKKMRIEKDLADRNNMRQAGYSLNTQIGVLDYKEQIELRKRGPALESSNKGTFMPGVAGTTSLTPDDEAKGILTQIGSETGDALTAANNFSSGYANTLLGIFQNKDTNASERELAKETLRDIYGTALKNEQGAYVRGGFDMATGQFIDKKGIAHATAEGISGDYDWKDLYSRTKTELDSHSAINSHAAFAKGDGKILNDAFVRSEQVLNITDNKWKANNQRVKAWGTSTISDEDNRNDWQNLFFTSDNKLKNLSDYTKDYLAAHPGDDVDDAEDSYEDLNKDYNKIYNSGNTIGKDNKGNAVPLIESTHGTHLFGQFGGGTSAGGGMLFTFDSEHVASLGAQGAVGIYEDALSNNGVFTIGNYGTMGEATKADNNDARTAMAAFMADFRAGNLTKAEKANVLGQVMYMDVAGGDKNKVGATFFFPPSWLKKYAAGAKEITWADNPELINKGVTMYTDKATAKNAFTTSAKMTQLDYIINNQPVNVTYENAGDITINKRDPNTGIINVIGHLKGYDANGNLQTVEVTKPYAADVSGDALYRSIDALMKEVDKKNSTYMNLDKSKRIYDPNKLPEVQGIVNQGSNQGPNQTDMFNQGAQTALYSSK